MAAMAVSVEEAFAYCETLARTHYENFTVGSFLLPKAQRAHVYNLYAFCRNVDDLGDEAPGDRLKLLDDWEADLRRCYDGSPEHPCYVALQQTIRAFDVPIEPFLKLVKANRMDQTVKRHRTFEDLCFYCDHSANPCGRLFLYVFGYRDAERQKLSDNTCTALQLTNFWQDIAIDWGKGRVYIPQEDLGKFGVPESAIEGRLVDDAFRKLMAFEVERTRGLFHEGLKLLDTVSGRLKFDLKLFSHGGMGVLDAIERNGYDVYAKRPTLSKGGKIRLMIAALLGLK